MWLFDKRKLQNIEYILLIIIAAISIFGLLAILMATAEPSSSGEEVDFFTNIARLNFDIVKKQLMWILISFALMACIAMLDYHIYAKIWYVVVAVCVALIVYTAFFGIEHGGTRGWIKIGGAFEFQPTEIGKLGLVLVLAKTISKQGELDSLKKLLPTFAVMIVFVGALMSQMDIGTSLVYVFIFLVMLFAGGMKWNHIVILLGLCVVACVLLWFIMGEKQQSRIINFFTGDDVTQLKYSKIAISSGGFFGKGILGQDSYSQMGYIYAINTDFIFAAICESLGFLGAFVLIAMYAVMEIRLWYLYKKAYDKQGAMIILGIMAMFMFHIFENIGMVIGIMPITGIPLPFVSYGGSNLLTNMIGIGLVESVCMNRPIQPFTENK